MQAYVVTAPHEAAWTDLPEPVPAPNEALVRIDVCGICNSTDAELRAGVQPYRPAFPYLLGHESVGEVLEVGSEVTSFKVGDRITRAGAILPGDERDGIRSAWGAFSQLGLAREGSRAHVVLPGGLEPEIAFLAIALAETRAWLEQVAELGDDVAGKPVVVVGTGIAGLTLTHWAKLRGGDPVITLGRREERLTMARVRGADHGFLAEDPALPEQVREATGGARAAVLLGAIGKPAAIAGLVPLLAPGGLLAIYGAAPGDAYQAATDALPEGIRWCRPGPEEFRYTRQCAEGLLDGTMDHRLWLTHVWERPEIETAFRQVAAGEVLKGCVRLR
ncbi:MAG: alcohol dehydrogenase catalytic domain-containing protein [Armatimonadetes bacterium]|nr:alcohol dehydrogenase catalytic domain-containing protein [Armatimonadota bacterium]